MTLTGCIYCLRGGHQSKIAIGYEKDNAAGVPERFQFPDRIVTLLEKILGSFLKNKLLIRYIEYVVKTQRVWIWYSKSRLGLCHIRRTIRCAIHRESREYSKVVQDSGDSLAYSFPLQ